MTLTRSCCALALLLCALPIQAAERSATETVIVLTLHPQAAPKPALKYALLPELKEFQPGYVVQGYLKCFAEQQNFFFNKDSVADREKWQTIPLKDLPDLTEYGGNALRQADYAARLETVDWQILAKLRVEGAYTLLPEIQQLRTLATGLKVRYRGEVSAHHFDDAIRTHKTIFALGRQLGQHPTLIGNLVGIAIAGIAIGPFEELIQQEGAPNLFWALSSLPKSLVGIGTGIQSEREIMLVEFKAVVGTDEPVGDAVIRAHLKKIREIHAMTEPEAKVEHGADEWMRTRSKNADVLKAAAARLVASGIAEEKIKRWPPLQVVIRDEYLRYETQRDEMIKWVYFPSPQALEGMREAEEVVKKIGHDPDNPEGSLMVSWSPVIRKVYFADLRLQQRLALLQNVEALRLYSAENAGKLPEKLESIKLPLLPDPVTGKPFVYKLNEKKAILQGSPPKGQEKQAAYNVRYEITLAK